MNKTFLPSFYLSIIIFLFSMSVLLTGCGSPESSTKEEVKRESVQSEKKDVLYQQGVKYLSDGRIKEAIISLGEAIKKNPRNIDSYFLLSRVYMNLQEYELAKKYLMVIVQLDRNNGEAFLLLGGCFDLMGNKEEAVHSIERSLTIFQSKRDEENFKKAGAILQVLTQKMQ